MPGGENARRRDMASKYCTDLAKIAEGLHDRFHLIHEGDEPLRSQIKRFWLDIGMAFPGVGVAWSAVFVSSCVKKAGATAAEFKFAAAHAVFVNKAIANAKSNSGVFRAFDIATGKPEIGDIIQNNRGGHKFDFNFAAANTQYESHSAIVVETGSDSAGCFALTVGGNESDSIRRTRVPLTAAGLVKQRPVNPFICVIKTLK
jgi:hypothetical protein